MPNSENHGQRAVVADVGRHEAEGVAHSLGVADNGAAAFDRQIQPLVRIDCQTVGALDALVQSGGLFGQDAEAAVSAVDVEPQSFALA